MWSGWVGNDGRGGGPVITNAETGYSWKTFPERALEAGITWKVYQDKGDGLFASDTVGLGCTADAFIGNYGDNSLLFLKQYQGKRSLKVIEADGDACLCEGDATAYVVPGTVLSLRRKGKTVARAEVGELPPVEQAIPLEPGDRLDLVLGDAVERDAIHDDEGALLEPARVGCALAEASAVSASANACCSTTARSPGPSRRCRASVSASRSPARSAAAPSCAARRASTCPTPICICPR
jgi:hypothetical protein